MKKAPSPRSKAPAAAAPTPAVPVDFSAQVIAVIAEVVSRKPQSIQLDMTLRDLVEDSYDLVEMVMTLKDRFDATVVASEFEGILTVADLVTYIKSKRNGPV